MADTRSLSLVDAFASAPLAGSSVAVISDAGAIPADSRRALADEMVRETVLVEDDRRRVVAVAPDTGDDAGAPSTTGLIAVAARLFETGALGPGEQVFDTPEGPRTVDFDSDGVVWVERPGPSTRTVSPELSTVASALGVDPAALRDVGADVDAGVADDLLVVPVNFLARLGEATPTPDALAELGETHDVDGVCAFTFDAVDGKSTCHVRTFRPDYEVAVSPAGAAAVAAHLRTTDAFDDGEFPDPVVVEQGQYPGRPGTVRVRFGDDSVVHVGGHATTAVEGRVVLPELADDEILEA